MLQEVQLLLLGSRHLRDQTNGGGLYAVVNLGERNPAGANATHKQPP